MSTILAKTNKQYCFSDNRMNHKSVLTYFINFLKAGSNGTSVSPAYYRVTPAYTNWQFIHIIAGYTHVLYSLNV